MAQAKLEGRLQNTAKYRMMGCACNTAREGQGQGHRKEKKKFPYSGPTACHYFLPRGGQTGQDENVPCRPHATGTNQHHHQQNTCTQQI